MMISWFEMGRANGGPALYMERSYFPTHLNLDAITVGIAFALPILIFLVLLPSFRNKHWQSLFVLVLCCTTGSFMIASMLSLSWMVGHTEVTSAVGPSRPQVPTILGVWVGLDNINMTYHSHEMYLNENMYLDCVMTLRDLKKERLIRGYPWPLVTITGYLGGEGYAWDGDLGRTLRAAGLYSKPFLIAALYMWAFWCVLFLVAPGLTPLSILLTGVLQFLAACTYAMIALSNSKLFIIISGTVMTLRFGWCCYSTAALGMVLIVVGIAFYFMELIHPGVFTTVFEIDFGGPAHRSYPYMLPRFPSPTSERSLDSALGCKSFTSECDLSNSSSLLKTSLPLISQVTTRRNYINTPKFLDDYGTTPTSNRTSRQLTPNASRSYKYRLRKTIARRSPLSSTRRSIKRAKDPMASAQRLSYIEFPRIDDLEMNMGTSTEATSETTPVSTSPFLPIPFVHSPSPDIDVSVSSIYEATGSPSRTPNALPPRSELASNFRTSTSTLPPTRYELVHEGTRRHVVSEGHLEREFEERETSRFGRRASCPIHTEPYFSSEFQLRKRTPPTEANTIQSKAIVHL